MGVNLKLTENLEKCPTCGNLFYKVVNSRAELFAKLEDGSGEGKYVYCSEACLLQKLENLKNYPVPFGSISLRVKNETRVEKTKESPVIYIIGLSTIFPKLEGTDVF